MFRIALQNRDKENTNGSNKNPLQARRIMKVSVEKHLGEWAVRIVQGNQRFHLRLGMTKADAQWMAKMFRIALHNHDKEKNHDGKK